MPTAGFIGLGKASPHKRSHDRDIVSFTVNLSGLTQGRGRDTTVLGYILDGGLAEAQRWQTSPTGSMWSDIPGATGPTQGIDIAGGIYADRHFIRVGVTVQGQERFSAPVLLVHAPPTVNQVLIGQVFTEMSGLQSYDASVGFTGNGLTFSVSTLDGVSIDAATGVLEFDTDQISVQNGTVLTVTAINSGGMLQSTVSLTIAEQVTLALEEIAEEPMITLQEGAVTITLNTGLYAGTYDADIMGRPLTVDALQTAPMCLVRPGVSGSVSVGNPLSITPGLWLYEGLDAGDQSWQHQLDGVDIVGGTDLEHIIVLDDLWQNFSVIETYGGQSVSSASLWLGDDAQGFQGPLDLGTRLHTWLDLTDPASLFIDHDQTMNVTSDGDVVNSVLDRSGNDHHAESSHEDQTNLTWDASARCLSIASELRALQSAAALTGAGEAMELFVALKTADGNFMLASAVGSTAHYFGVAVNGNSSFVLDGSVGSPVYHVDTIALNSPATRGELSQAWATDSGLVAHASGLDLTDWEAGAYAMRYLDYAPFGWGLAGKVTHIVLTQALTPQERGDLVSWLQTETPT